MHQVSPIPALNDNYIWMIVHPENRTAAIVDPGDAKPVLDTLQKHNLTLTAILITHHHWDHTNGIAGILDHFNVPVYGPTNDKVSACDHKLQQGDTVELKALQASFSVLDIPGHTLGHIAYVGLGGVFCGDTLFTGGCGRIFEGTPQQMLQSLDKLSQLDSKTLIYCGHEYTQANLKFAATIEPNNQTLQNRITETQNLRNANKPTVPATIATELATNPFLRVDHPSVQHSISTHYQQALSSRVDYFAKLREWKNHF